MADIRQASVQKKTTNKDNYFSSLLANAGCEPHVATPDEVSWFKIENYDFVREMPLRKLIGELFARKELGIFVTPEEHNNTLSEALVDNIYADITSGKTEIGHYFQSHPSNPEIGYLAKEPDTESLELAVRELTVNDIRECHDALHGTQHTFPPHPCAQYSGTIIDGNRRLTELQFPDVNLIYLSISPNYSKSQLIASFKYILDELENKDKEGVINDNFEPVKQLSHHKINNINSHKTLLVMDLLLWQFKKKWQLPTEQIYKLVNGIPLNTSNEEAGYNRTNFIKTTLGSFEAMLCQGTFEQLVNTLRENQHLYDLSIIKLRNSQ